MARSYVAIYQNKEVNYFVYFDFNKHEFFKIAEPKNQSLIFLASFTSIVFYALMKNVSLATNITALQIILISSMIGIVLGYISTKLTNRAIEKGLPYRKKVIHPTEEDIRMYLIEGKKTISNPSFCYTLFSIPLISNISVFIFCTRKRIDVFV